MTGTQLNYSRLIPNFADLTSPLTDLTRKGASDPVQWTEQCQLVFEEVKQALCEEPLLHTPNFSLPFTLQTDAWNKGLGAVLSQQGEGVDRPVLHQPEAVREGGRYSTVEKECLAIRWAVDSLPHDPYVTARSLLQFSLKKFMKSLPLRSIGIHGSTEL